MLQEVETEISALSAVTVTRASAPDALGSLQLLWEQRRLLLRVAVWGLVIGTAIAFLIPSKYESTVSVMPPDSFNSNEGLMMAALAGKSVPGLSGMASNLLGMKSSGALFVNLACSRTVQDHIVERFHLQRVYGQRYEQDARRILNERTGVAEDRKSGVITLTAYDRDPRRARDIAEAYIEELNGIVSQVSTSSARRERIFIEQRITAVRADLEDAEKQFGEFASKNTTLDIKEQTKAMVESAALLQGQVIAAQSELQSLEQIYNSNNVRVRAARARIDELNRQLRDMGGTDASMVADTSQSNQLYPPIRKLPLLGVQWADLYRRMTIQETVYELLNQQYELARIQEAKEIPSVNVIDPANLPEKKSWPPRLPIALAIAGLAVAVIAAWLILEVHLQQLEPLDPRRVAFLQVDRFRKRSVAWIMRPFLKPLSKDQS